MNELGLRCGQGHPTTLGAFRRHPRTWVPGAVITFWQKCARTPPPGVEWPHALFITDGGSIYCPACREELAQDKAARAAQNKKLLEESPF